MQPPPVALSFGRRFGRRFTVSGPDAAGGVLFLGGGTPAAHDVFGDVVYDLVVSTRTASPYLSLLALGVDRPLLDAFDHAERWAPLDPVPRHPDCGPWTLLAGPGAVTCWNPLDAPWLSAGALAALLVDLAEDSAPLSPPARPLAVTYLATLIAAYRLLPDPWFTFRDLHNVLDSDEDGARLIDRATDAVFAEYRYVFEVDPYGLLPGSDVPRADPDVAAGPVPDVLREIVLTRADVAASCGSGPAGFDPGFANDLVREGRDPVRFTYEWQRTENGTFSTLVGAEPYSALLWVLKGHHAAVRSFDTGARPRPLPIPFGARLLSEPSAESLVEMKRITTAYHDLFWLHPRRLTREIECRLRPFFRAFLEPPFGAVLSPSAPGDDVVPSMATRLPPLAVLRDRGSVVVSAYAAAGAHPETAHLLDVLLKRLWLSLPPQVTMDVPGRRAPATVVFAPRYDRAVLSTRDVAADAAAFLEGPGRRVIPVLGSPSLAALDHATAGRSWLPLLASAVRTRVILAASTGSALRRIVGLLSPAAPRYRREFLSRWIARLDPGSAVVSYTGARPVFGIALRRRHPLVPPAVPDLSSGLPVSSRPSWLAALSRVILGVLLFTPNPFRRRR